MRIPLFKLSLNGTKSGDDVADVGMTERLPKAVKSEKKKKSDKPPPTLLGTSDQISQQTMDQDSESMGK